MIAGFRTIALCTARIHDMLCYEFVTTLNKILVQNGFRLFVYNICTDLYWNENTPGAESSIYTFVDNENIEAVIVMDEKIKSKTITQGIIERAKKFNKPVFVIDGNYPGCHCISFDYSKGFENVVRHVIEHHHIKKPHFMSGIPENASSEVRVRIFKRVLTQNGIRFTPDMVSYGGFSASPTQRATEMILARGNLPEAIICANDVMALNVTLVLQKYGVNIPRQVLVTGFDGIQEIYSSVPQITSCFCDHSKIATLTATKLLQVLDGKEIENELLVEPDLIISESCGCHLGSRIHSPDYVDMLNSRYYSFPDETRSLFRIVEKMQQARSPQEASQLLNRDGIYSLTCILSKQVVDSKVSLTTVELPKDKNEPVCLFYDSDADKPFVPKDFPLGQVIPNMAKLMEKKYPLIFNSLDFMGIMMGFVCFHFENYNAMNYTRIPLLMTALRNAIGGFANMQYQRYLRSRMESLYQMDSLTQLFNRHGFNKAFEKFVSNVKERRSQVTVVLSDLDSLKYINDRFGHSAGDLAIQKSAEALKNSCPSEALCVRFGGDEMLAVMEGRLDAKDISSRIKAFLDQYNSGANNPFIVSTSVGVYNTSWKHNLDFETLVRKSDAAMYRTKKLKKKHGFSILSKR